MQLVKLMSAVYELLVLLTRRWWFSTTKFGVLDDEKVWLTNGPHGDCCGGGSGATAGRRYAPRSIRVMGDAPTVEREYDLMDWNFRRIDYAADCLNQGRWLEGLLQEIGIGRQFSRRSRFEIEIPRYV
jgi:hypothetical protein